MSDIYKAPEANLANGTETDDSGSIEKGIAGDYSFSIGETISEAWERTSGNKGTIWVGAILYLVASMGISFVITLITGGGAAFSLESGQGSTGLGLLGLLAQLITTVACAPLGVGMAMIGIKIARDEQTSGTEVFSHFDKIVPLGIATIVMYLLVGVGFLLLVIPGIYLLVAYILALPLIADRNLGPWAALEASRKAISKNWFAFLGFLIVLLLIYIAGGLALLIGLIWALPLGSIAYGVAYRKVFGSPNHI
ncbi:hypothetical protein MO867_00250 [Microbulbifer sp. OS29]|uniref:Integral membrane protein n=1 Tax=Microbulbifer okhotskensis TaxID=2926617 RepID=A0A9X2EJF7_9GAMM|nr:hypothetical protein [Microbulbifer okhotskensis]MCO1332755.1 hypothetical protein [Microbulbifer okhotskensis]